MSIRVERYKIEHEEGWDAIREQIPYLVFPADWQVRIIPPFAGAVCRFNARLKGQKGHGVSVYLDWHENLGFFGGKPYWEAYPIDDNNERFALDKVKDLIKAIDAELRKKVAH